MNFVFYRIVTRVRKFTNNAFVTVCFDFINYVIFLICFFKQIKQIVEKSKKKYATTIKIERSKIKTKT